MSTINLRELRRRLPHGSLARIAEATGISARFVSEVFNFGWHVNLRGRVCDAALSILDETKIDSDVIKHAEELGVASTHSIYVPPKSPRKRKPILYEEPEEDEEGEYTREMFEEMDEDDLEWFAKEAGVGWFNRNFGSDEEVIDELCEIIGISPDDDDDQDDDDD